tara:strand:+ start:6535 stop:7383 length:849 start_codon:yes stop_codon:yes gene_type:complete
MTEEVQNTVVQSDNTAPVTESAESADKMSIDTNSDNIATPSVEIKDGKTYVNGQRTYSRDDTNKIAANAKREAESRFLNELNVDSLESVKSVVQSLQESTPNEEGTSLNVDSLRDAVRKREATVEELKSQVNTLRTELLLKDHMGQLQAAMPNNWSDTQRNAVVKLMQADNMLAVEGDTFAIRNGADFLTTDGETPDYAKAVELVGTNLGLSFGKKGVEIQYGETTTEVSSSKVNKPLDDGRVLQDAEYRAAYMNIRQYRSTPRNQITDTMVKKQMEKSRNT